LVVSRLKKLANDPMDQTDGFNEQEITNLSNNFPSEIANQLLAIWRGESTGTTTMSYLNTIVDNPYSYKLTKYQRKLIFTEANKINNKTGKPNWQYWDPEWKEVWPNNPEYYQN
jgi:hypothetical protein